MESQKIDPQLNMELEKSDGESVEVIIKYVGEIDDLNEYGINPVVLLGGYGILSVSKEQIINLVQLPQIVYIELPKRLYFAIEEGISASCINSVTGGEFNLDGRGTIVAIVDSGIDYSHSTFMDDNGKTRILELWDQTIDEDTAKRTGSRPPAGYNRGALYSGDDINRALMESGDNRYSIVPSIDISGHGTAVASIAAGRIYTGDSFTGIATQAGIIAVKLGNPGYISFPKTSELMQAIDFCVKRAAYYNRPVSVNISFGNNYGPHDGTGLLSSYIDEAAGYGKTTIIVGSGNEGTSANHSRVLFGNNLAAKTVEINVGKYETGFNLQIWKSFLDELNIEIISPYGNISHVIKGRPGLEVYTQGQTQVQVYYGEPSPYTINQEIYMEFVPENTYVDTGIWKIRFIPEKIVDGRLNMWLPVAGSLNDTRFLEPWPETTLTVPSAASKAITVGAYDQRLLSYADFSGRGYTADNMVKPDIVAPGVGIKCAAPGGGYTERTGTSFATPFVTGSVSLMNQWGIVDGNDLFLYGQKAKAYLRRGANPIGGEPVPSPRTGYGALCLKNSIFKNQ